MRGFRRTFATGVACWQGTLIPPGTFSRPIWDLHMFYLLRPILLPNLYFFGLFTANIPRYFVDFAFTRRARKCWPPSTLTVWPWSWKGIYVLRLTFPLPNTDLANMFHSKKPVGTKWRALSKPPLTDRRKDKALILFPYQCYSGLLQTWSHFQSCLRRMSLDNCDIQFLLS